MKIQIHKHHVIHLLQVIYVNGMINKNYVDNKNVKILMVMIIKYVTNKNLIVQQMD